MDVDIDLQDENYHDDGNGAGEDPAMGPTPASGGIEACHEELHFHMA